VCAQLSVSTDLRGKGRCHAQLQLEDPKLYMLFYDYFFRNLLGQETFERNIHNIPEEKECFGTPTYHGFAHLILRNNQDEWEEKINEKQGSFLTIHDDKSKA
jgi:hypothetical protein